MVKSLRLEVCSGTLGVCDNFCGIEIIEIKNIRFKNIRCEIRILIMPNQDTVVFPELLDTSIFRIELIIKLKGKF